MKDVILYLDNFVLSALSKNTGSIKNMLGVTYPMLNYPVFRVMGAVFLDLVLNYLMELLGSLAKV